jgi:hypothetical protein
LFSISSTHFPTFLFSSLFGDSAPKDGSSSSSPASPSSLGWAKFKETNPDEFRTPPEPLRDQRGRRQQQQQDPFMEGGVAMERTFKVRLVFKRDLRLAWKRGLFVPT